MGRIRGLKCVRCGRSYGLDLGAGVFEGCPECAKDGQPANLTTVYDIQGLDAAELVKRFSSRPRTMWRYLEFLPADSLEEVVTLREGCTPLIRLRELEEEMGVGRFFVKDESRNPTGSFKDRLASCAVTNAVRAGARVTAVSSTGNCGSSTAAYSSSAGLLPMVFTLESVPPAMKTLMQVYGGRLVACRSGPDRWKLITWGVREKGWYPVGNYSDPAIGSNPFGVDGYKSMALEMCEDLGWHPPSAVIQPTAYGDGLYGAWKGFVEAEALGLTRSVPRMFAAEVSGSLSRAMAHPERRLDRVASLKTAAFSIETPIGTQQAMSAMVESGGGASQVTDDEVLEVQQRLGRRGTYAEASSCASVAAAVHLARQRLIGRQDTVVAVLTSTGQRDPGATQARMPAIPVVDANPASLAEAVEKAYGLVL